MSRYLTPEKISLVLLVALYGNGFMPKKDSLPILSFITSHLLPIPTDKTSKKATISVSLKPEDFKSLLTGIKTSSKDKSLWDTFVSEIAKLRNFENFFTFFDDLDNLFKSKDERNGRVTQAESAIVFSRTSVFGIFIRRAMLEFERLQFHDAMTIWRDFEMYREKCLDTQEISTQTDPLLSSMDELSSDPMIRSIIDASMDGSVYKPGQSSVEQTERILTFQIDKMEKYGTRIPANLRAYLEEVVGESYRDLKLHHYYRFLDAWCAGDFLSAFENLHRHYDYATHNKDRSQYQYALLNMAILQADFGCFSEALAAINETIATARENKDMACLNFSLSWLYNFRAMNSKDHEKDFRRWMLGSERETLNYIRNKAHESGLWNLMSSNLLNEAKFHLAKGENPRIAFERVMESSHMNVAYSLDNLNGAQVLVQSAIFGRLGVSELSTSYCQLVSDCYATDSSTDILLKAYCRLAYIHTCSGAYEKASKLIKSGRSETQQNIKIQQYLDAFGKFLQLKRSIHNHNFRKAEDLIASLKSSPASDPDMAFEISMLELEISMRQQSFATAFSKIDEMSAQCENEGSDVCRRMRLLSMKALLFAKCGRPQKGLSISLRAAAAAYRSKTIQALWLVIASLGIVLNGLQEHETARVLLESIIYQAAESEDLAIRAQLESVLADAYMGQAGQLRNNDPVMREALANTLYWVDAACKSYQRLEDLLGESEMHAKASVINRLLGNEAEEKRRSEKHIDFQSKIEGREQ